jgi:hypothetical protein
VGKRCVESCAEIDLQENIALGLYSPDLFDPVTGEITPEALKITNFWPAAGHLDDCGKSSGLSVARTDHVGGIAELYNQLESISSRRDRKIEGHANIKIFEVEQIDPGILCVLDDGMSSFRTHAVIRSRHKQPNGRLRLIRNDLLRLLNTCVTRPATSS